MMELIGGILALDIILTGLQIIIFGQKAQIMIITRWLFRQLRYLVAGILAWISRGVRP